MKILVNATAADSRGALVVLRNLVDELSESNILEEKKIHLVIYVSVDNIVSSNNNIKIVNRGLKKKNLIDKLIQEKKFFNKIIKEEAFDAFLGLVNTGLGRLAIPQFVMIHTAVPFSKFQLKEYGAKVYFKYRILMNLLYLFNINKYNAIFVQTKWMKDSIINDYKYNNDIHVIKPYKNLINVCNKPLSNDVRKKLDDENCLKLLYVTSIEEYKNNKRLIDAIKQVNKNDKKVRLYITLDGYDDMDISYIGKIDYSAMNSLYESINALIFPSLVESLGLPLMEFMQLNKPILAADLPYAREICGDRASYFDPLSIKAISDCISGFVSSNKLWETSQEEYMGRDEGYTDFIRIIYDYVTKHQKNKTGERNELINV